MLNIFFILNLIFVLLFVQGCASLGLASFKDRMLYSVKVRNSEIASSDSRNNSIISEKGVVDEPELFARVDNVRKRIQNALPRKDTDFQVHILRDDQVNAFTTGGRHIYFNKGLIEDAKNDDEIACVIAHEIAHSLLRHSAKSMTIGLLTAAGVAASITAMKKEPESVQAVIALGSMALPATFSRGDEHEADVFGASLAFDAGYDITKAQDFFNRMREKEKAYNSKMNSTLLPTLNITNADYNNALTYYNSISADYKNFPTEHNYAVLLAAQDRLNTASDRYQAAREAYLNFSLSNIALFRTHPNSGSRANTFILVNRYLKGTIAGPEVLKADKSAYEILNSIQEIKELDKQGFMTKNGVCALEAFNKGRRLYEKRKFKEARKEFEKAIELKPDYNEAKTLLSLVIQRQGNK